MSKINNNGELPSFPVEILHPKVRHFIEEQYLKNRFSPDYLGASYLAVLATLCSRIKLKIKNGYIIFSNIYVALIGPSGSSKSGPISSMTKVIELINKKLYEEYQKKLRDFKLKASDDKTVESPILKQIVVNDTTGEALNEILFYNKSLLALYDELGMLFGNANRYSGSNILTQLLSIYDNKSIMVNRKNRDSIQLLIDSPILNILGGIQPDIAYKTLGSSTSLSSGFTNRFLITYPDPKLNYLSKDEIDETLFSDYLKYFEKLIHLFNNNEDDILLNFSPEAFDTFLEYSHQITNSINESDSSLLSSMYSKLEKTLGKISIILHMEEYMFSEDKIICNVIQDHTIKRAVKIIDYFKAHNTKFYEEIDIYNDALSSYPERIRSLYMQLPSEFDFQQMKITSEDKFSERSLFRYLKDKNLFEKVQHDLYRKII